MARQKYRITADDARAAAAWIQKKLDGPRSWPHESGGWDKNREAKEELREFSRYHDERGWAEFLNTWCEKHLNSEQWNQLKNAIRASRKREAERQSWQRGKHWEQRVRVDLRARAHWMLRTIAKRHQMTLSEVIEHFLREEYERCL